MSKVEFNAEGLCFVTCPDCADERDGWKHDNPQGRESDWVYDTICNDANPCALCHNTGDLCTTILIERDTTPERLAVLVAGRRDELDAKPHHSVDPIAVKAETEEQPARSFYDIGERMERDLNRIMGAR
jgi:hypothetical protein